MTTLPTTFWSHQPMIIFITTNWWLICRHFQVLSFTLLAHLPHVARGCRSPFSAWQLTKAASFYHNTPLQSMGPSTVLLVSRQACSATHALLYILFIQKYVLQFAFFCKLNQPTEQIYLRLLAVPITRISLRQVLHHSHFSSIKTCKDHKWPISSFFLMAPSQWLFVVCIEQTYVTDASSSHFSRSPAVPVFQICYVCRTLQACDAPFNGFCPEILITTICELRLPAPASRCPELTSNMTFAPLLCPLISITVGFGQSLSALYSVQGLHPCRPAPGQECRVA